MKKFHIEVDIDESFLSILEVTPENSGKILKQLSAVALYQAKKVTLTEAALISEMNKREFEDFLFDLGVPHEFYTIADYEKDKKFLGI